MPKETLELVMRLLPLVVPLIVGLVGWLIRLELRLSRSEDGKAELAKELSNLQADLASVKHDTRDILLMQARLDEQVKTLFNQGGQKRD